jgi:hypothetical protein
VFYFRTNKHKNEDEKDDKKKKSKKSKDKSTEPAKYVYTSRDNDAAITDDWVKMVHFAPLTPSELAKHWSDLMTGLMFTDRQFAAFDEYYFEDKEAAKPLTETEKKNEWAQRSTAKRTLRALGAKTDHSAYE